MKATRMPENAYSTKPSESKAVIFSFAFLGLVLSIKVLSSYVGYFGVNTMDCIKGRYFFVSRCSKNLKDGDYFAFYFKGSHLYPKGVKFIKIVGCSQGERLITKSTPKGIAYFCNGRLLGYACDKKKYARCPEHIVFNGVIPKGCYFAVGTAYNSYDSRYYGLVCSGIIGKAYKIF